MGNSNLLGSPRQQESEEIDEKGAFFLKETNLSSERGIVFDGRSLPEGGILNHVGLPVEGLLEEGCYVGADLIIRYTFLG